MSRHKNQPRNSAATSYSLIDARHKTRARMRTVLLLYVFVLKYLSKFHRSRPVKCILFFCRAPVAVGTTVVSSRDLIEDGMRGKGVVICHVYLDLLWFVHILASCCRRKLLDVIMHHLFTSWMVADYF